MDDDGHGDGVALAHEPRLTHAHDDVLRTMTLLMAEPALESAVTARTVARQVVSESGKLSETRAWPLRVSADVGLPVGGVGEVFADSWSCTTLPGFTCASCGR